jgi:hypothetical protein
MAATRRTLPANESINRDRRSRPAGSGPGLPQRHIPGHGPAVSSGQLRRRMRAARQVICLENFRDIPARLGHDPSRTMGEKQTPPTHPPRRGHTHQDTRHAGRSHDRAPRILMTANRELTGRTPGFISWPPAPPGSNCPVWRPLLAPRRSMWRLRPRAATPRFDLAIRSPWREDRHFPKALYGQPRWPNRLPPSSQPARSALPD